MVVGQHPKSGQWTMAGEVSTVTHGGRAYWIKFHEGGGRLFSRVDLKPDMENVPSKPSAARVIFFGSVKFVV